MSSLEFCSRPNVKKQSVPASDKSRYVAALQCVSILSTWQELTRNSLDFGQPRFSDTPESQPEIHDRRVRQAVHDHIAAALRLHEVGGAQYLEVLRDIRERHPGLLSQGVNVPWRLR
jgi:hypothetical protein